ncbi:MAG: UDP-N-acetylmuramoyl-L-alanyl-D-glutamate--2,6-diaminopimelate ligase [Acidimicrobiia bacterium]
MQRASRHSLADLAAALPGVVAVDPAIVSIIDITHDSRQAGPAIGFAAVHGMTVDGHRFAGEAAAAGAPMALVERRLDIGIPQIVVDDTRTAMAWLAAAVHGNPSADLAITGVTGTNGKTTITAMCEAAAAAADLRSGVIGTLGARIAGKPVPLQRTTPESTDLQRVLASMREADTDAVFMEVSSHALSLHRVDAIGFDVGAFTNLTQDHLDFHGDMESYFAAKRLLFDPNRIAHAVINVSDPYGQHIAESFPGAQTTVAFGADADIRVDLVSENDRRSVAVLTRSTGRIELTVPLPGWFNALNAAMAFAICDTIGIDEDSIIAGLRDLPTVSGRMQRVEGTAGYTVVVDYAHTPAAIATVIKAARGMVDGRVIVVVGAGGDRDRDKRPLMGKAAAEHADVVIVTTDNPRSEDPSDIAAAVAKGAASVSNTPVDTVLARSEAILRAVSMAGTGDIVLILGRGHEPYQEVASTMIPFDDIVVAAEAVHQRER